MWFPCAVNIYTKFHVVNLTWSGFSFFITCIRKGGRHESELMRELGLVPGNFPTQSSSTILRFGYVSTSQSFMWLIFINIYRRNLEYCFWFHISWKNHWLEFRLLLFTQSCPILWDPMDCSMPGFPVLHHLLEFARIHVHWAGDAFPRMQQKVVAADTLLGPATEWSLYKANIFSLN